MRDIEIVLQGSINDLLDKIWGTENYNCINIFKHSAKKELIADYFYLEHLKQIMTDPDAEYNAVYVLVKLTKKQEEKYLLLIDLVGEYELLEIIYEEHKNKPTLEY